VLIIVNGKMMAYLSVFRTAN